MDMEYWKRVNDLLEKHYECFITIKFNEVEDKIVVFKYDITGKSAGQMSSWSKSDIEALLERNGSLV